MKFNLSHPTGVIVLYNSSMKSFPIFLPLSEILYRMCVGRWDSPGEPIGDYDPPMKSFEWGMTRVRTPLFGKAGNLIPGMGYY